MSLFTIADLHLSLGCDKPMDIFSGWDNYVQRLEENWRYRVDADDFVVVPGDISWAMGIQNAYNDFEFIHRLPGKKIILKGNHDYWWTTKRKIEEFLDNNGFYDIKIIHNDAIVADDYIICGTRGWFYEEEKNGEHDRKIIEREAGRLSASIAYAEKLQSMDENKEKKIICFMHYPPVYRDYKCSILIDILKRAGIKNLYYGHLHAHSIRNALCGEFEGINMQLVSADSLEFTPYLIK